MKEKDYTKNSIIGIVCNIIGLFILGYVFSGISYSLFDKNYKNSLNDHKKRRQALWGKVVSTFFVCMSLSYHGQSRESSLDERMGVSCITALILTIIMYFILNSKDKKILAPKQDKEKSMCTKQDLNVKEESVTKHLDNLNQNNYKKLAFCKNCGGKLDENKKCIKCGKQYLNLKFNKNVAIYLYIGLLIITNMVTIIMYIDKKNEVENILEAYSDVDGTNQSWCETTMDILTDGNSWTYTSDKLDFFDENIVFVIEGYGNYFYNYDCVQKITDGEEYSYWAYNKEAAISKGYQKGTCYN